MIFKNKIETEVYYRGGSMEIQIKNVNVHYEIYGSGESTLLLLHGWMASINAMAPIWQYFQKDSKVVVLDFPGQGGTSEGLHEAWGVPEYAQMVKELMQQLGLQRPDVIGHSFGGRVIIYLASQDPQLFHKIVLTDAAGIKPKTSLQKWLRIRSYKIAKAMLKAFSSSQTYEEKLNQLRKKYGSSDYGNLASDVMRETFQKVISLDLRPELKKIQNPTLLMWGENDTDTPLYMAKIMEKEIPDSGLVVLPKAGHFSYLDASGQYNLVVENFLSSRKDE